MSGRLSAILLILCFGNIFASAQSAKETPAPPTGLALEVTFFKGNSPAFQTISGTAETARGTWYALFGHIADFQTSAERLPVRAVNLASYLERDTVKINVTVYTGEKFFDREETVGAYSLREGERIFVKELTNFGVKPFEIAVVRVAPSATALPSVDNKTASLQVTGIEPNFSTLPSFKLRLQNTSDKAVAAFTFEAMVDGRLILSAMPQGERGEPLIEAGATLVSRISSALEYKQSAAEFGQIQKQPAQTVVVSSVIFADGSFEGDVNRAAPFRAFVLGRKIQVRRIIALLEANEAAAASDYAFNKFADQAAKLETKISERQFGELLKEFPALGEKEKAGLREDAEIAARNVKKEFSKDAQKQRAELEATGAHGFLKTLGEQYRKWLARLQ